MNVFKPAEIENALRHLAGTERVVFYDVPEAEGPQRPGAASPYVSGGPRWWQFVRRRRDYDDGAALSLLVSLRGLREEERQLAVGWGAAYANAFLLIEPADPWLDLTAKGGIEAFVGERGGFASAETMVRAAYADWVYWRLDAEGSMESHAASLVVADADTSLWRALGDRLPTTFSDEAFLSSMTLLTLRETELFGGGSAVWKSITPFLTRLGLPILYDVRPVLSAVRDLVNAGLAGVRDPEDNWRLYQGPEAPLPEEVSDERLATMVR